MKLNSTPRRALVLAALTAAAAASAQAPSYSRLQLKSDGQYLDAAHCTAKLTLNPGSTYAGGACQLWRLVPAGNGWSRLQLKSDGRYLDAVNCTATLGLNAGSTYANGDCQLWRLVPIRPGGQP